MTTENNSPDNESNNTTKNHDQLVASIDERISTIEVRLNHKENRFPELLVGIFVFLSIVFIFAGNDFLKTNKIVSDDFNSAPLIGLSLVLYLIVIFAFLSARRNMRKRDLTERLESLKVKRNLIRPLNETTKSNHFDRLVEININNLGDYYAMVKEHTNKSFFASILAGASGFLLIVTGLLIGFSGFSNSTAIAYISAGSGVVIEFISGVFFWLYSKTARQLKDYHDRIKQQFVCNFQFTL